MKKLVLSITALALMTCPAFAGDSTKAADTDTAPPTKVKIDSITTKVDKDEAPKIITTKSGLKYADLIVGTGVEAANGMPVVCHYTLWLTPDGAKV
jgi:FKBP-type peptidyl-prolyl cis-trans isomerase